MRRRAHARGPAPHDWAGQRPHRVHTGTCEQITTVRRFIAQHDGKMVETSVVGEANVDPLYARGLASRNLTDDLSVVVVDSPSDAALVV